MNVPAQYVEDGGCASQDRMGFIIVYLQNIFVTVNGMCKLVSGIVEKITEMPQAQLTKTIIQN